MFDKKLFKNFDYALIVIVVILVAVGMVMIKSATSSITSDDNAYSYVIRQGVSLAVGLVLMFVIIAIDYNTLGGFYWYFYGFNIALLLAVKIFGKEINGAKSWIQFGSFSMQPSEFSKILFIIFMAKFISLIREKYNGDISSPKNLGVILGLASIPLFLIYIEPALGTAMVLLTIIVALLFAANLNYKYFLAGITGILISSPLLWFFVLKDYQKNRIIHFLNPDLDPLGKGFQVIQSKIAIGSGGLWGQGLFQGTQTQMGYLPFKETDFIFAVLGEELGFVLCMLILLLYGILLLKLIDIARNSKDLFGSMLTLGIAAMIGIHIFQNVGMTMGLFPVAGIPLPFISYGGSSLIANLIGIGLVLNVSMRRQKITF